MLFPELNSNGCLLPKLVLSFLVVIFIAVTYIFHNSEVQRNMIEETINDMSDNKPQAGKKRLKKLVSDQTHGHSRCRVDLFKQQFLQMSDLDFINGCDRIVYGSVPKCGSRTVKRAFKSLAQQNNVTYVSGGRARVNANYFNRQSLLEKVKNEVISSKAPLIYASQMHFVDFTEEEKKSGKSIAFINVLREPTERLASHYYYNIYGSVSENRSGPQHYKHKIESLDDCMASQGGVCQLINQMLPFFCGQTPECRVRSMYAFEKAKRVYQEHFLLVGFTEDLSSFMEALEFLLPNIFHGLTNVFYETGEIGRNRTRTRTKIELKPETRAKIKDMLHLEYDFYYFARQDFYNTLKTIQRLKSLKTIS